MSTLRPFLLAALATLLLGTGVAARSKPCPRHPPALRLRTCPPREARSVAIAFGASGEEFLAWKAHLEGHGLDLRISDHDLAYSLYFSDPWRNLHEITTYERDYVAERLA